MAPPRELYNESASRFSGWFLGNPGMGFLSVADNREVALAITGGELPDDATTLGFRPEHVKVVSADSPTGVAATVRHAAIATGGQLLVNLQSGELSLKAKLPSNSTIDVKAGAEVRWSVDPDQIRMFGSDDAAVSVTPARS